MRPAGARWSEQDLTKFTRNSGRGLPKPTLQHIANSTGEAVDINGEPIPATPGELQARAAVDATKRQMEPAKKRKAKRPNNPLITPKEVRRLDNQFLTNLEHRAGKYKNTKRIRDGIKFDSILEADQYTELVFLQKAGKITYFLRQVPIHLPGGVILRVDFVTFLDLHQQTTPGRAWAVRYLDTKGHQTRESKNKIKQAKHEYGIVVELVKKVRKLRS
jgi:hypothetical protein